MRDFLKYTFATLVGLFLFIFLSMAGLFSLILASAKDSGPRINDKTVLLFDLSQPIRDTKPDVSPTEAVSEALSSEERVLTLRRVLDVLDHASRNPKIVGLYLYSSAGGSASGYATLKEIRKALADFRKDGKPIFAYQTGFSEREYYVSSVANTIAVHPMGLLEINGFSSEAPFLAGALQRLGVGVQVVRVGKYKAAVEPLLLTRQSQENKQQEQKLLNDLWSEFLLETSQSRKLTPQQLQAIADSQGSLTATEAEKRKLVDRVSYVDELTSELKQLTDSEADSASFRQISITNYAKVVDAEQEEDGDFFKSDNQVALVYAEGEIVNGQGTAETVGGDRLARQLRSLRFNENVKAIVLRINSPGGSATASDVIQREVILTRKVKPVIISMGSLAASGGYWIATYGDRIFAEPNTITGSIGVFGVLPNVQKLTKNNGITWDGVKTGKYADIDSIARPKTVQELALYQKSVNEVYDQFITKVAESRKLPRAKVAEIAQGRVWSGKAAKQLGLVDELGGLDDALQAAAKKADLGNDWQVEEYPKPRSLEERFLRRFTADTRLQAGLRILLPEFVQAAMVGDRRDPLDPSSFEPFSQELTKIRDDLAMLRSLNDPIGVYARLPYNLQIR